MSKRKADAAFVLTSFGKESYASQSAIAGLLKQVRDNGLPNAISRASLYRQNLHKQLLWNYTYWCN